MRMTEHFDLVELTRSATATRLGLMNVPPQTAVGNLRNLCQKVLEPLRQHLGKPIIVTSGYRSKELNKAVGGVENSQHLVGEAADLRIESEKQGREWMVWIMDNCEFDQLILERNAKATWLHVSCKRNRQEVKFIKQQ